MEYLAIFFTYSGAIKYDKFLKSKNIKCRLMPIPRKLSSSCAIGARFTYREYLEEIIQDDIQKVYLVNNKEYELVYNTEE